MGLYDILCNINEDIIKGEKISNIKQQDTVECFLNNISSENDIEILRKKFGISKRNEKMYPLYYLHPYIDGKKYRIISGYLPKTNILSLNHFELEILRLLALWQKENENVKTMLKNTLVRLDKTCFGHYCSKGECVGASVTVLRLLNVVEPGNNSWIKELLDPLGEMFINQKGMGMKNYLPVWYFSLVLSELPIKLVEEYIYKQKEFLKRMLTRGCLIGPGENDTYNIIVLYIIRNTLCRIKEFEHIRDEKIFIKDNRCYCKI